MLQVDANMYYEVIINNNKLINNSLKDNQTMSSHCPAAASQGTYELPYHLGAGKAAPLHLQVQI